jgi:glutaredoxin
MHSVVLYTRPGCHLCDVARVVVQAVVADLGATCAEVDIRSSPELLLEYATRIPVVEVDGREHAHFRVDPDRLRDALGGGRAGEP